MKQYILKYKSNGAILGWYCTKEAAWDRMNYLTDTNFFGVFEVSVKLKSDMASGEYMYYGTVLNCNDAVLNVVNRKVDLSESSKLLIEQGVARASVVQFSTVGKELKPPKPEKDEDF